MNKNDIVNKGSDASSTKFNFGVKVDAADQ